MKNKRPSSPDGIRSGLVQWFQARNILFVIIIAVFVAILLWSEPISGLLFSQANPKAVATAPQEFLAVTPTPLTEELLSKPDQTTGIILGAVAVVLVILTGVAVFILRARD